MEVIYEDIKQPVASIHYTDFNFHKLRIRAGGMIEQFATPYLSIGVRDDAGLYSFVQIKQEDLPQFKDVIVDLIEHIEKRKRGI